MRAPLISENFHPLPPRSASQGHGGAPSATTEVPHGVGVWGRGRKGENREEVVHLPSSPRAGRRGFVLATRLSIRSSLLYWAALESRPGDVEGKGMRASPPNWWPSHLGLFPDAPVTTCVPESSGSFPCLSPLSWVTG